ncbi:MAG: sulfite oxidase [Harvfovirus sp.]|uniref:Sulfite oxidase n=1 Tax=Harvfovirus sp. TaxID=2487768 RepID=A0A3G5A277_9VIRU|nr:MAG: sulfite oxidase [Harvfovirus sp.]
MEKESTNDVPQLITIQLNPDNRETPINFIDRGYVKTFQFFRRNHFDYPKIGEENFYLTVLGLQEHGGKKAIVGYKLLQKMESCTVEMVLECAGNRRIKFTESASGVQWGNGAISYGKWKGVTLNKLLAAVVDLRSDLSKCEVLFTGHDFGKEISNSDTYNYQRSLPLEKALDDQTIVAYAYNDKPLTREHGHPLRLIVPGWYGMASVKWLKSIEIINKKFTGEFQKQYVYAVRNGNFQSQSVTTINVNSLIQMPLHQSNHAVGESIEIRGIAYSGEGLISKVEISLDNQKSYSEVTLLGEPNGKYSWRYWVYEFVPVAPGSYTICVRACDTEGRIQPSAPLANIANYGYNAISKITINIKN